MIKVLPISEGSVYCLKFGRSQLEMTYLLQTSATH